MYFKSLPMIKKRRTRVSRFILFSLFFFLFFSKTSNPICKNKVSNTRTPFIRKSQNTSVKTATSSFDCNKSYIIYLHTKNFILFLFLFFVFLGHIIIFSTLANCSRIQNNMTQNSPLSKAYQNFPRFLLLLLPCVCFFHAQTRAGNYTALRVHKPKTHQHFSHSLLQLLSFQALLPILSLFLSTPPTTHHPQQQTPENQKNCDLTRSGYFLTN